MCGPMIPTHSVSHKGALPLVSPLPASSWWRRWWWPSWSSCPRGEGRICQQLVHLSTAAPTPTLPTATAVWVGEAEEEIINIPKISRTQRVTRSISSISSVTLGMRTLPQIDENLFLCSSAVILSDQFYLHPAYQCNAFKTGLVLPLEIVSVTRHR